MTDRIVSKRRRALMIAPVVFGLASQARAQARGIVMLVQMNGPNIDVDRAAAAHLQARGHEVRLVDQATPPHDIGAPELVIVSSTVSSKDVAPGWRTLAIPMLTWENDLLDDFAMTGKRHGIDFGEVEKERYLWLVNAPHALSGGLSAGVANVYRKQAGMSWGKPGLGASIIATIYGQPEKSAVFAYEKGATMDYESLAPARRVMFFLGNETFTNLSAVGLRLFDAAIDWAAQRS